MKQKDFVIKALKDNGKVATLNQLYNLTDIKTWQTKTPYASIRRIIQTNKEFFKIQPGLWGLKAYEKEILERFNIKGNQIQKDNEFTHSYYQGIIVEIGNLRGFKTYIPPQDKNKIFIHQKLGIITSLSQIYNFSYENIVQKAKNVDVIWFNERKLPCAFFEVEHSTDFKNSLNKFFELQDFRAKFTIVARKEKLRQFENILQNSIYAQVRNFISFADYESIVKQYEKESFVCERGI